MPHLRNSSPAGTALLLTLALGLGSCGGGAPEPDNAAIDRHLNQMIVDEQVERRRLVEEARTREEAREKEMEQRSETDGEAPD